jgi:hypothetical protein
VKQQNHVVFVGPSLHGVTLPEQGLVLRAPIQAGDILALLDSPPLPRGVLVIDGIFGAGQAISVGELRMAVDAGVAVFGSTSMGALRAAEGQAMGMVPLGSIAAEYVAGTRTSDADVALLHTQDGRALTAPTVNVEQLARMLLTLGAEPSAASRFVAECRAVHFTRRTFRVTEELAERCGLVQVPQMADLVHRGRLWDRKSLDAQDALATFSRLSSDELERIARDGATILDLVPAHAAADRPIR